MTFVIVTKH